MNNLPNWVLAVTLVVATAVTSWAIYDNRMIDFWPPKIYPKPTGTCPPTTCVTDSGKCGQVKLSFWCSNPDGSRHGCHTTESAALPEKDYLSATAGDPGTGGKRAAARWACVALPGS